jgi:hypothetical protein
LVEALCYTPDKQNTSLLKVAVQGLDFMAQPYIYIQYCRMVSGSIPDEIIGFSVNIIQQHYKPGVNSASNKKNTRNLPEGKGGPAHNADIAICEPTV